MEAYYFDATKTIFILSKWSEISLAGPKPLKLSGFLHPGLSTLVYVLPTHKDGEEKVQQHGPGIGVVQALNNGHPDVENR